jgi:surface antigen
MNPRTTLSSYLVQPDLTPRRRYKWSGFRTRFYSIKRANPHIISKTIVALMLWSVLFISVRYTTTSHNLPGQASIITNPALVTQAATQTSGFGGSASALPAIAQAKNLPGGPSGYLLPPGTMAADRTYTNSYAWGQCTWYVAGRRPIPGGWGNAASWYYHAIGSGWKVGTAPAIAAVAWTPTGYYGHVALVEKISADGRSVYVSEMNYRGVGVKSYRWAAASSFKYIY